MLSLGAEDATRSTLSASSWTVILGAVITASLAGLAYGTSGVVIRRVTTGVHNVSLPGTLVLLSTTGVVGLGLTSWLRLGTAQLMETTPPELWNMLAAGCLNAIAFFACGLWNTQVPMNSRFKRPLHNSSKSNATTAVGPNWPIWRVMLTRPVPC